MSYYFKDFDGWNRKKLRIEEKPQPTTEFYEKEIWWASLGINIGREIDGKGKDYARPVLIIKRLSPDTLWIIPISKTLKHGNYFHITKIKREVHTLLLLQIRMISAKRLMKKIERISTSEFAEIIEKMKSLFP